MEWLHVLGSMLRENLGLIVALVATALALAGTEAVFALRRRRTGTGLPLARPLAMLGVTAGGIVAVILALPLSDNLKIQLLSLLGLALTGVIALSSTTFVGNAMGALMLRAVGNFRAGDWVRVGEQLGRVTERGLFHTEIQTEDRDLVTLPNLYLVTNPVKVVRTSGTVVSTQLSLGYDVEHGRVEGLLAEAATASGLEEPFVQILQLGDFSVTYRVAGFLTDVGRLLSVRSQLCAAVLDTLHGAGVEILSPNFMSQRPLPDGARILPPKAAPPPAAPDGPAPEDRIFDKAAEAEVEELGDERARLLLELAALEKDAASTEGEESERIEGERALRRARLEAVESLIAERDAKPGEAGGG